jgi:DNA-3-methyladenine glycosylase II
MSSANKPSSGHMPRTLTRANLSIGARQLADIDDDLANVISRLGEPPLWGRRPGFATLVRIILEQQVSLAAAHATYRRLFSFLAGITPERVHAMQISGLRAFGLTRQKSRYCHGLAERILSGRLNLSAIARGPDDVGRQLLLSVPGLGPWSVDIYYLMALRRPDIWPRGDLALVKALCELKRLERLPSIEEQLNIAAAWSPWRSVAARVLWSHYLAAKGRYTPSIDQYTKSSNTGQ